MMQAIRKRIDDDKGFTLIELMVVVLIIAILIAIAIPTFLGLRQRAQNRAAQSDVRNGLVAAKAWYTDGNTYELFTEAEGTTIEPSLPWLNGASTPAGQTLDSAVSADFNVVAFARMSASGSCFTLTDVATGIDAGTYRNAGDDANCVADGALVDTDSDGSW